VAQRFQRYDEAKPNGIWTIHPCHPNDRVFHRGGGISVSTAAERQPMPAALGYGLAPFPLHVNQSGSPQFTNRFAVAFAAQFADNYAERPCAPQLHRKDVAGHRV
jgi:hypothetical protein